MQSNKIIFADLSTYTPRETMAFYSAVFNWDFVTNNSYSLAYKGNQQVVGLYETPDKFKQMRMPHFWMTYIQVEDVVETVNKARALGGIIELIDETNPVGAVALIRDPQGAGFTIYQGDQLNSRTSNATNTLIWNELHVSDIKNIIPFYQGIFDWTFQETDQDIFQIYTKNGDYIADAMGIPNAFKGKYEYWVCTFGVENLTQSKAKILEQGGSLVFDEGERLLMTDNSGEAFFYIQEVDQ